jgi:hypothetical protein
MCGFQYFWYSRLEPSAVYSRYCEDYCETSSYLSHSFTVLTAALQSTNPFTPPQTKVNYFSVDFDMQVHIASARLARKVLTTSPMKYVSFLRPPSFSLSPSIPKPQLDVVLIYDFHGRDLTTRESFPGSAVPDDSNRGSDAAWRNWIKSNFNSVSHPIGTCAMMKRSLGGKCLFFLILEDEGTTTFTLFFQVSLMPT